MNRIKRAMDLKYRRCIPTTGDNHIGLEIEYLTDVEEEKQLSTLYRFSSIRDGLSLGHDSSVYGGDLEGTELRVLFKEKHMKETLSRLNKFFDKINAQVNSTCGLHVHIDMRNRNPSVAYNNLFKCLPLLKKLVSDDRQNNIYCPANEDKYNTYSKCVKATSRFAINPLALKKHGTIEVRLHEGTLDFKKIYNWITLLIAVVDSKRIKDMVYGIEDLKQLSVAVNEEYVAA